MRLACDFLTTAFAARIAAPSSPVRFNMELATSRHWRLRFGDLALWVNREASDGVQGTSSLPSGYARSGTLGDSLRRLRRRLPKRIVGPAHHIVVPGSVLPANTRRTRQPVHGALDAPEHPNDWFRRAGVLGHCQPLFFAERLPDFFSAKRVALRRKDGGWERDSCSGVSCDSGVQLSFFICGLRFWDDGAELNESAGGWHVERGQRGRRPSLTPPRQRTCRSQFAHLV